MDIIDLDIQQLASHWIDIQTILISYIHNTFLVNLKYCTPHARRVFWCVYGPLSRQTLYCTVSNSHGLVSDP